MLRDEVKLFEKLSGESANDVTIVRLGSFLDGYYIGKEETVKHAHWRRLSDTWCKCSCCGHDMRRNEPRVYCPVCGAKMDEADNEDN